MSSLESGDPAPRRVSPPPTMPARLAHDRVSLPPPQLVGPSTAHPISWLRASRKLPRRWPDSSAAHDRPCANARWRPPASLERSDGVSAFPVPLLDLRAQYASIRDEVRARGG